MFNIYGDITGSNKDGAFNYTKNGVSDINRKKLVQYTDGAQSYENVKKVKPVDFVYKTDERERKRRGIIVQDAQDDIDPEWGHAVENEIGETTIFLDNNAITMDTLLALKFAIDKIEHLEERLAKME
ncbi:tail fiber domain-containing protein [Citrobacter sedlakii]|uniref:tail fiber domain-containing protein n=1 Tax=Citrobacter sedlakii TaxID=67826 RepID=UPI0035AB8D84